MHDANNTLTSPLSTHGKSAAPLLALTIVWHPDHSRIGEQFVGTSPASTAQANNGENSMITISRFLPLFRKPGAEGLALGHGAISRSPIRIQHERDDGVSIHLPISRMVVELNGETIQSGRHLTAAQIQDGQILGLGRTVLLCLHWMHCLPKDNSVEGFMGVGSAAITARDQIRQVANTEFPVLLLGETGTGKEVAAQGVHSYSKRNSKALVAVNMATLNESLAVADLFGATKGAYTGAQGTRKGLFGEAAGATLFLDEIGNAPASVQPMLLRVLEGGDYRPLGAQQDQISTARIIAATDQNLEGNNFNQALLRRLESMVIQLPPLRARREDIGVLIIYMLEDHDTDDDFTLPITLVNELACYHWPGNIRQLAHVLKRVVLALNAGQTPHLSRFIQALPSASSSAAPVQINSNAAHTKDAPIKTTPTARKKLKSFSETDVLNALEQNTWCIKSTAQALGISRPSMYKLLDNYPNLRRAE